MLTSRIPEPMQNKYPDFHLGNKLSEVGGWRKCRNRPGLSRLSRGHEGRRENAPRTSSADKPSLRKTIMLREIFDCCRCSCRRLRLPKDEATFGWLCFLTAIFAISVQVDIFSDAPNERSGKLHRTRSRLYRSRFFVRKYYSIVVILFQLAEETLSVNVPSMSV